MEWEKRGFSREDKERIEELKKFVEYLSRNYKLSIPQIIQILSEKEILIPLSIFNKKLSVLETVVKYLKENLKFNFHKIGELIGRDERNIWHTYNSARKKYSELFEIEESQFFIPVSIFRDKKFSALEAVTVFMKDQFGLNYKEISDLIKRDQRTVWTVYNRSKKKHGKK